MVLLGDLMLTRPLRMLLLALVAGLLAVLVAYKWIKSNRPETAAVVVLTKNVATGSIIGADSLQLVMISKAGLPAGTLSDIQKAVGRIPTVALLKGEPLIEARLAPVGTKAGLAALVAPGKRAMTVAVNDVVGVAGFALPGTFVDVLVHTRSEGQYAQPISKIVLEKIQVLAVAQDVDRNTPTPQPSKVVTLEVTPEQAESLDLARSVGVLALVLRGQNEKEAVVTMGATKDVVLGLGPTAAGPGNPIAQIVGQLTGQVGAALHGVAASAPTAKKVDRPKRVAKSPEAPRGPCVEVIRGVEKVQECF